MSCVYAVSYIGKMKSNETLLFTSLNLKLMVLSKFRTKFWHRILAQNFKLDNLYYYPIIYKNSITLFLHKTERRQTVLVHYDKEALKQNRAISAHQHTGIDEQYPRDGTYSVTCAYNSTVYSYIFNKEKPMGKLWVLDLNLRKWHKCFQLHSHVISNGTIVVTPHERLILHGKFSNESCSEKAHLYHFGVSFCEKKFFPTIHWAHCSLRRKPNSFMGKNILGNRLHCC